jgi:hypothetical protein
MYSSRASRHLSLVLNCFAEIIVFLFSCMWTCKELCSVDIGWFTSDLNFGKIDWLLTSKLTGEKQLLAGASMVLTTSAPCCMVTISFIGVGILAFGASQIENLLSVYLNLQQDCCVLYKGF